MVDQKINFFFGFNSLNFNKRFGIIWLSLSLSPARTGTSRHFSERECWIFFFISFFFIFLASLALGWLLGCHEMMLSTMSEKVNVWVLFG